LQSNAAEIDGHSERSIAVDLLYGLTLRATVSRSAPNKPSRIIRHDQREISARTSFVAFDGRTLGIQKHADRTLARLA